MFLPGGDDVHFGVKKTEVAFYPRDFRFAPDKRTSREAEKFFFFSLAAYR